MKYPLRFRILAVFTILISGLMLVIALHEIFNYNAFHSSIKHLEVWQVTLDLLFLTVGAWTVLSSVFWFAGSRFSYVFLYTSGIALLLIPMSCLYFFLATGLRVYGIGIVVLAVFTVYAIIPFIMAILPSTRTWAIEKGAGLWYRYNPAILAIFTLLVFSGPLFIFALDKSGRDEPCHVLRVQPKEDNSRNPAWYAADLNMETAWSPRSNPAGINEWLDITLGGEYEISRMEIYPGAYNPADNSEFIKYSRVKAGYILLPDNTKIEFRLEDANRTQQVKFGPRKTSSLRIVVTDVYRGAAFDRLFVSEIRFFRWARYFGTDPLIQ